MTDEEKKAKKKEWDRRYYERHKEQVNKRNRKWRTENEEKFKEIQKQWYERNKEGYLARLREKYWADVEKSREVARQNKRKWRLANPERYREYNTNYNRRWREKRRNEKMNARRALFESRLRNVPRRDVLERIYDLLEWRGLWRSLRSTSFEKD